MDAVEAGANWRAANYVCVGKGKWGGWQRVVGEEVPPALARVIARV